MRIRNVLTLPALALTLSACASLNSVSVTPIPADRSHQVSSQADRWVILGLNFDNDYADKVSAELAQKCPGGKVSGILTKDESYMYFLFFVMKHKITATGYCGGAPTGLLGTFESRAQINKLRRGADKNTKAVRP